MQIRNFTPHLVRYYKVFFETSHSEVSKEWSEWVDYPSEGVARVATKVLSEASPDWVTLQEIGFGEVTGLPEPEEGTRYIVSSMVFEACPERHDLIVPIDFVRDSEGRIEGCRAFRFRPFLRCRVCGAKADPYDGLCYGACRYERLESNE